MNDAPVISWDTSVFLAWLQNEQTAPLDAMNNIIAEMEFGQVRLAASVVLFAELLESTAPPDQLVLFEKLIHDDTILLMDVDRSGARTAGPAILNRNEA